MTGKGKNWVGGTFREILRVRSDLRGRDKRGWIVQADLRDGTKSKRNFQEKIGGQEIETWGLSVGKEAQRCLLWKQSRGLWG